MLSHREEGDGGPTATGTREDAWRQTRGRGLPGALNVSHHSTTNVPSRTVGAHSLDRTSFYHRPGSFPSRVPPQTHAHEVNQDLHRSTPDATTRAHTQTGG